MKQVTENGIGISTAARSGVTTYYSYDPLDSLSVVRQGATIVNGLCSAGGCGAVPADCRACPARAA